ncbi:MAG: tRNA pseudouridine(38-40) synthase TruA [Kineosporiaceae bacterium]
MRWRLDLQYEGTAFHGWAAQPGLRTVEGVLAAALGTVLRVSADGLAVVVAGRTDAGVHATGQVCHVDVPGDAAVAAGGPGPARRRLAGVLPEDVRVDRVVAAPPGFDARFSALRRRYRYRVCDHPAGAPPLDRHRTVVHPRRLDTGVMARASTGLTGLHDFAAFCRRRRTPRGTATTVRTLEEFGWRRDGDVVEASVVADAFCHSMVRALVGCLLAVGDGRRDEGWPGRVLAAGARDPAVTVAPARGLTLVGVDYPLDALLGERAMQARAVRDPAGEREAG